MITEFKFAHWFLSNYSTTLIEFEGLQYSSVEHAYQAAKTLDPAIREEIRQQFSPGAAKYIGRRIVMRPDWEEIKMPLMRQLLEKKFSTPSAKAALLETGDQELIEGNTWHDQFWGNCICPRHLDIPGQNNLGKMLMQIRQDIREGRL
jgi:ribA/ribD-fused uncharacterized protein